MHWLLAYEESFASLIHIADWFVGQLDMWSSYSFFRVSLLHSVVQVVNWLGLEGSVPLIPSWGTFYCDNCVAKSLCQKWKKNWKLRSLFNSLIVLVEISAIFRFSIDVLWEFW